MKVFVTVSRSCESCGGQIAVKVQSEAPSESDETEKETARALGGMFCVRTESFEIEVDSDVVVLPESSV